MGGENTGEKRCLEEECWGNNVRRKDTRGKDAGREDAWGKDAWRKNARGKDVRRKDARGQDAGRKGIVSGIVSRDRQITSQKVLWLKDKLTFWVLMPSPVRVCRNV